MTERLCKCGTNISERHINTKQCTDCSVRKNRVDSKNRARKLKEKGVKQKKYSYYKGRDYSAVD